MQRDPDCVWAINLYAKTLRAITLEHDLKTSGLFVIKLKKQLTTWFREQKHVEQEINKFFAEPSDEGIENVSWIDQQSCSRFSRKMNHKSRNLDIHYCI